MVVYKLKNENEEMKVETKEDFKLPIHLQKFVE